MFHKTRNRIRSCYHRVVKILSVGDWIRPGAYAVQARYARSMLLTDKARRALFVVDPSIGAGPLNLVVAAPHAFLAAATLSLPQCVPGPRFDSAMPRLDRTARANLRRVLVTALPRYAPAESLISLFRPATRPPRFQLARDTLFRKALAQIAAGRLATGIRLIRGCGEGLTPAGDDFLCGWMLACRMQRQTSLARRSLGHARGRNEVANAFLELAAAGRVNQALHDLLRRPTPAGVARVCAFGHSSGADLLCGLRWGLDCAPNADFPVSPGKPETDGRPRPRGWGAATGRAPTKRAGLAQSGTTRRLRGYGGK